MSTKTYLFARRLLYACQTGSLPTKSVAGTACVSRVVTVQVMFSLMLCWLLVVVSAYEACNEKGTLVDDGVQWTCTTVAPEVVECECIVGFQFVNNTFSYLYHTRIQYQVIRGSTTSSGAHCVGQTGYQLRKVESRRSLPEPNNTRYLADFMDTDKNMLLSQGLTSLEAEYEPGALRPSGLLFSNATCRLCNVEVRMYRKPSTSDTFREEVQHARRFSVTFTPAFIGLASHVLLLLRGSQSIRELRVTGGEDWGDPGLFLVNLGQLTSLDLSHNGLIHILQGNFQAVPAIEELNLAGNNFTSVPEGIKYLQNLTLLDLSRNPLKVNRLSSDLEPLHRLQRLNLSGVALGELAKLQPLLGPRPTRGIQLVNLDLSYCKILSLADESSRLIFHHQALLQVLNLTGNPVHVVPPCLFRTQQHLSVLVFARMRLSESPGLLLGHNTSLQQLDLSRNDITSLSRAIVTSGNIKWLDLSYNRISPWTDSDIFSTEFLKTWVQGINFSYNRITTMSKAMGKSMQILDNVDLGGNPFDCGDCNTQDLRNWLMMNQSIDLLNLGVHKNLTCQLPISLSGQEVTALQLDMGHCRTMFTNYTVGLGVSMGMLVVITFLIIFFIYHFRFEIIYLVHIMWESDTEKVTTYRESVEYKYDAFICYSDRDRTWVIQELVPYLERGSDRYRLCLHEREFRLGAPIIENIIEFIHSSRKTLLVLTTSFITSQWCQWEMEIATNKVLDGDRNFLILIELHPLDHLLLPRHIRLHTETRTFLQWPQDNSSKEQAWRRLKNALGPSLYSAGYTNMPPAGAKYGFKRVTWHPRVMR